MGLEVHLNEGRVYKDGPPMRGGECRMNKGRAGSGRGEDWCILGHQREGVRGREEYRCGGYAGPAFIPISENNTQFSFLGVTPPLSTLRSSLGVGNPIPFVWRWSHDRVWPIRTPYPSSGDWLRDETTLIKTNETQFHLLGPSGFEANRIRLNVAGRWLAIVSGEAT